MEMEKIFFDEERLKKENRNSENPTATENDIV